LTPPLLGGARRCAAFVRGKEPTYLALKKQILSCLEQYNIQRVRAIGAPQFLALTGQRNPDEFLFTTSGIDRYLDSKHPGGFAGWIDRMIGPNPDAYVFFETQSARPAETNLLARLQAASLKGPPKEVARLVEHIERHYTEGPQLIDRSLVIFMRKNLAGSQPPSR
jgi:hypothetical protein